MAVGFKKPKTFKSMLQGLTCEKHKIGHLTQQARADLAYQETLAEVDVNAITSYIVNKNADDRLPGIYLVDSICQNVGGKYVPLFEEHIFPLIETSYRYGSKPTRQSLCKILNIWKARKIFPIHILRDLYKAIRELANHPPPPQPQPPQPQPPQMRGAPPPYESSYDTHAAAAYNHAPPPPFYDRPPPPQYGRYPPPPQPRNMPPPPLPYADYGGPPQYPPPSHHHPPHHRGPPPMQHSQMETWPDVCRRYNIPVPLYESIMKQLIHDLDCFIESPYTFKHGIFVQTPQLQHANFACKPQLVDEFRKCVDEFHRTRCDITRKLYFITDELKHDGVNTSEWQEKLNRIAPFLLNGGNAPPSSSAMGTGGGGGAGDADPSSSKGVFGEICMVYNSMDGCRLGANCPYLHVTHQEAELSRKLYTRVDGRYELKDVKFEADAAADLKLTTFYSFFGAQTDLKRKHARSVSLLYSKKLKKCPNCSLRVTANAFGKHMKWHFNRRKAIMEKRKLAGFKSASSSQQYGMYRNWYCDEDTWLHTHHTNKADGELEKLNPFDGLKAAAGGSGGGAAAGGGGMFEAGASASTAAAKHGDQELYLQSTAGGSGGGGAAAGGGGGGMFEAGASASTAAAKHGDQELYLQSTVLLSGQKVVVCDICQERFAQTDREYNAQKDDWLLKNACYEDGTTSKSYPVTGKPPVAKPIVHRKCFELKKKQRDTVNGNLKSGGGHLVSIGGSNEDDEDDALRPKLHDPQNILSKMENQLNEKQRKQKTQKTTGMKKTDAAAARDIDRSVWASDSDIDDDDEDDDDSEDVDEQEQEEQQEEEEEDEEEEATVTDTIDAEPEQQHEVNGGDMEEHAQEQVNEEQQHNLAVDGDEEHTVDNAEPPLNESTAKKGTKRSAENAAIETNLDIKIETDTIVKTEADNDDYSLDGGNARKKRKLNPELSYVEVKPSNVHDDDDDAFDINARGVEELMQCSDEQMQSEKMNGNDIHSTDNDDNDDQSTPPPASSHDANGVSDANHAPVKAEESQDEQDTQQDELSQLNDADLAELEAVDLDDIDGLDDLDNADVDDIDLDDFDGVNLDEEQETADQHEVHEEDVINNDKQSNIVLFDPEKFGDSTYRQNGGYRGY
eukprot:CAMPEP_0202727360 /NCGR_PEP_ID=MMETSP1385-20130828/185078_1 /ASSEMBLY_ACC=CAM_ASM_000861 /TAXON_ID=933848 /ORGANISM="Elphidium margaritaceum" /LENGTH=1126 /DNA_ID=CAMNT_0049393599 /DNA_START=30 /DNA_END=3410 /DNA_ORIENTATION=-